MHSYFVVYVLFALGVLKFDCVGRFDMLQYSHLLSMCCLIRINLRYVKFGNQIHLDNASSVDLLSVQGMCIPIMTSIEIIS